MSQVLQKAGAKASDCRGVGWATRSRGSSFAMAAPEPACEPQLLDHTPDVPRRRGLINHGGRSGTGLRTTVTRYTTPLLRRQGLLGHDDRSGTSLRTTATRSHPAYALLRNLGGIQALFHCSRSAPGELQLLENVAQKDNGAKQIARLRVATLPASRTQTIIKFATHPQTDDPSPSLQTHLQQGHPTGCRTESNPCRDPSTGRSCRRPE